MCVAENAHPISLRFAPPFVERLERAAKAVGVPKHTLAQAAIIAAVEAIEEAKGKVVMPIELDHKPEVLSRSFVVRSIPAPNRRAKRRQRKDRDS